MHTLWSSVYANDLSPEAKDKLLNHPDHLAVLHVRSSTAVVAMFSLVSHALVFDTAGEACP